MLLCCCHLGGFTMKKIDFYDTKIENGFWKEKQDMIKNSTVDSVYTQFYNTHRFDAFNCDWKEGEENMPHVFWDSDVAKWIEGVSFLLKEQRNEKYEKIIDDVVDKIVSGSDENGYYNSHFLVTEQDKRFKIRNCHELYCAGHLIEAAVAYYNATGKDKFLKAMCKFADYIEKCFKIEKSTAFVTPGHPEIELALVKLYEATCEKRYLELSKFFIDMHGTGIDNNDELYNFANNLYNQDEMPLRKRTTAEGHCVRSMYLMCGAADIAEKYNDSELLDACKKVFDDIVNKKMYITGGIGSTHIGEAFSIPYSLPNRTAYTETCAAISLAMFCERMQRLDIDSKYADVAERVIYNGFLSGVSMDGTAFFYENPLEIDTDFNNPNPSTVQKERFPITQRKVVFDCSCCPPNIVRFIPSIANLMYTYDDETIFVHQYMDSKTKCEDIKISQKTDYPKNGQIKITVDSNKKYIALRIPGWCRKFDIDANYEMKNGYAYIILNGKKEINISFDMPVVAVRATNKVHDNSGRVAVMRGPVVYCAEGVDNGKDLQSIAVDINAKFEVGECDFLLPSITTEAYKEKEINQLYDFATNDYDKIKLKLIPYFAFANRDESEMLVWLLKY